MRHRVTTLILTEDTVAQFDAGGGQRSTVTLPKGFIFEIPTDWVYNSIPETAIRVKDLKK
jgi:hypothetical protein